MSTSIIKQSSYEIKKSKFIGIYLATNNVLEFNDFLSNLKSQHKKASHFCYAYKIVNEQTYAKANDDGEPKGTAGYPIYQLLEKKQLINVGMIVIRYFGGTKLGKGLLIRSYLKTCMLAIE